MGVLLKSVICLALYSPTPVIPRNIDPHKLYRLSHFEEFLYKKSVYFMSSFGYSNFFVKVVIH